MIFGPQPDAPEIKIRQAANFPHPFPKIAYADIFCY